MKPSDIEPVVQRLTCSLQVLLKALPPVCMKYTAQDESRVANIARGEAQCYSCHETLIKSCILSFKQSGSFYCILHLLKCQHNT